MFTVQANPLSHGTCVKRRVGEGFSLREGDEIPTDLSLRAQRRGWAPPGAHKMLLGASKVPQDSTGGSSDVETHEDAGCISTHLTGLIWLSTSSTVCPTFLQTWICSSEVILQGPAQISTSRQPHADSIGRRVLLRRGASPNFVGKFLILAHVMMDM